MNPSEYVSLKEHEQVLAVLEKITDHFAAVMGGPMIAGRGVKFLDGVDGIPTIAAARQALKARGVGGVGYGK